MPDILTHLTEALKHPFQIRWTEHSFASILVCSGLYVMGICLYQSEQGRTRDGAEHGSAAWASPKQVNAMFAQKQNKILTRQVRLGLDTHKHRRSLNVLVIGGSGAAKTRSYVKPNILEANTNYVITDPKSEVLLATGGWLESQGYDMRVLNLVNLEQSDGYNPFRYLRDEKDALRLVNNLIQATTPKGSHESDPFWTKAETALLQAIILMLFQEAPEYEQNFSMVMRVLEYAEVKEEDEEYVSPLDLLFQAIERENPNSVAVHQYKVFKMAAGKTSKSILVSTAVRLAPFNLPQIQAITDHDDMDLYTLGEKKVAVYAVIPDPLLQRRPDPPRSPAPPRPLRAGRVRRHASAGLHPGTCHHAIPEYLRQHHHPEHGPDQGVVQGLLGDHPRQLGHHPVPGRKRGQHPQVHLGGSWESHD